jgi:glycogen synthase
MAALSAEQNKFKAEYISNNRGNVAGFMDEWDSRIAEEGFLESISTKYGVSFTNEDMPSNDDERTALLESLGAATESEPPRTSGQASRRPRK